MSTFFMFGKYSSGAVKEMSAERTKKAVGLIEKSGGEVDSMHALLGGYDLVLIVNFPGTEEAMKASIALSQLTGVSFSTFPAITVEQFDKMIAEM
ncbi:GYD domain-containing protein [candidate division KSB1 bacterium]|nr:GYD domain-containing protein [candidate division KSB1 bacterium]